MAGIAQIDDLERDVRPQERGEPVGESV